MTVNMVFGGYVTYLRGRSEKLLMHALHLYRCKISVLVLIWSIFTTSETLLQYGQVGFKGVSIVVLGGGLMLVSR